MSGTPAQQREEIPKHPVRYVKLACLDMIRSEYAQVREIWIPKGYVGTQTNDTKDTPVCANHSWVLNEFYGTISLSKSLQPQNGINRDEPSGLTRIDIPQSLVIACNLLSDAQDGVLANQTTIKTLLEPLLMDKKPSCIIS